MNSRLTSELQSFQGLWEGGYFEGNPLDPLTTSQYGQLGFMSVLHATYLRCIRPYVKSDTVALELGPGRGAWTKTLLPAREVYALDALPEEHNRFFEYLQHPSHVKYFQVTDFDCGMLPDNHFNYMFSFGCLCHVSFEGIKSYAQGLWPKLKSGSNCFWMIADYEKSRTTIARLDQLSILVKLLPSSRRYLPFKWILTSLMKKTKPQTPRADADVEPRPGRWYDAGIARTTSMLAEAGYEIVDPDVGTSLRDPIIHFIKP